MSRKIKIIITSFAIAVSVICFIASSTSYNFKIVKNLDLFFSAFREINLLYVDTVDADKVVKAGIEGMLGELDPYTVYFSEEDVADFDLATTGEYSGIGALIGKKGDYSQISEVYKGFPADKAGLVPGDLILQINGSSLKNKTTEEVSSMLKGEQGSPMQMKVVKIKTNDTVNVSLKREKVHISGITYSGIIGDSVGYIALSTFSKNCQKDFKDAFRDLQKTGKMKSFIIDLRGNTGGLVEPAVDIVGLFVPKGTNVFYSHGRVKNFDMSYKTREEPIDLKIPICVLVNASSASASEILAGALQDLDRAVIVGTRTFGKGLVQSVRPLGYNTKIKITTGKYYIPSGRCIQAYNFAKRNADGSVSEIPDSLRKEFSTKKGRKVFDGGGISPDISAKSPIYSDITVALLMRNLPNEYAIKYFSKHREIGDPIAFKISDKDFDDFVKFTHENKFTYQTKAEIQAKRLKTDLDEGDFDKEIKDDFEKIAEKINAQKQNEIYKHKQELKQLLEEEICGKYYYQSGQARKMLTDDSQLDSALNVLRNKNLYNKILR